MSEGTNSPQLLLLYTFCAAFVFLPRLTTYLDIPVTASLISHLLIAVGFLGTLIFLAVDSLYIISKLLFMLVGWLLRRGLDFDLSGYIGAQRRLPGSEDSRFWVKFAISAIAGIWLTFDLFFNSSRAIGKSWEAAKRNISARREEQKVAAAEQGGIAKDTDYGPAWVWTTCSFAYVNAVFDSREWFLSMLKGGEKVERTKLWEWVCLWAPVLISILVGVIRWRWTAAAKTRRFDDRRSEKKELGHESGATIA
ncbi:hypothetical protein KCU85_g2686, partial [Aureobasidium melanogenum]